MFDTFREPHFFTFSVIFSHIASIFTFEGATTVSGDDAKKKTASDFMRFSKCIKHFDSKCVKIDAICANFMLTLFVKIKF